MCADGLEKLLIVCSSARDFDVDVARTNVSATSIVYCKIVPSVRSKETYMTMQM